MPVVSLADLRKHLNWPSTKGTEDDDELLALGEACADTIEGYLGGRPIRTATVVERYYGGTTSLNLRRVPCPCTTCAAYRTISIDSVVEDGTTLTANDYTLDPDSGILWRGQLTNWPWLARTPASIVVTLTSGYTSTPPWVSLAQKRLVEHLWTRSQQARHTRGGSEPTEGSASPAYLLPYMVQSLLNPHRGPGF